MLEQITPIILTYNEQANIGRALDHLRWAHEVVVVDSFSTDDTLQIASQFSNVRIVQRAFDNFAAQWQFGLTGTGISTEWVMILDADFIVSAASVQELASLRPEATTQLYKSQIVYCIHGRRLRSGLVPALPILFRRRDATITRDGHTYRVKVPGETRLLRSHILHDDRKPLSSWLKAQQRYTPLEGEKLLRADRRQLNWPDRIRLLRVVAPVGVLVYCLVFRGGLLDGRAGFFYAFQRLIAESLLSLYLIERDLKLDWTAQPTLPSSVVGTPDEFA